MKPATLHKGRSWWVIPKGARGFNEMQHGFQTEQEARQWAASNGYTITERTEA